MFMAVTSIAGWLITSSPDYPTSPRSSAWPSTSFNCKGPSLQTDLASARDNLMGIFLGLLMMWLVFEELGSKPACRSCVSKGDDGNSHVRKGYMDQKLRFRFHSSGVEGHDEKLAGKAKIRPVPLAQLQP